MVPRSNLASLTIYVFETEVLIEQLQENAVSGKTFHIYDEIIPSMVKTHRVYGYCFDGYWSYTRTLDDYYSSQMDMLGRPAKYNIDEWRVRTNMDLEEVSELPPPDWDYMLR